MGREWRDGWSAWKKEASEREREKDREEHFGSAQQSTIKILVWSQVQTGVSICYDKGTAQLEPLSLPSLAGNTDCTSFCNVLHSYSEIFVLIYMKGF